LKNILLDVNIVIDVCAQREAFQLNALKSIEFCQKKGGQLWIYVGSVQTIEYNLASEIKHKNQSFAQAQKQARKILLKFTKKYQWLAALAGDGNVWADEEPEDVQLYNAVQRLPNGFLLTRDKGMLQRGELAKSPEQYLAESEAEKPIPFIDLKTQQNLIRPQLEKYLMDQNNHSKKSYFSASSGNRTLKKLLPL
jgi:UDP-2-acetamido-2-deoxy-ribo-hexuluronate aminotransferase